MTSSSSRGNNKRRNQKEKCACGRCNKMFLVPFDEWGEEKRRFKDRKMTIGLFDDNSIIVTQQILPRELVEPALLIAKIKGFESIDEYVIQLVKDELESIRDGGEKAVEFGNFISDYLERIIPSPSSSSDNSPTHDHHHHL